MNYVCFPEEILRFLVRLATKTQPIKYLLGSDHKSVQAVKDGLESNSQRLFWMVAASTANCAAT